MLNAHFDATLGSFHIEVGFEAGPGETTVLLGESGSGKTTVLRFLAGLLQADDGWLVLDDELYVDTKQKFSVPSQDRPIGYVFQDYVLFPHLTVYDNVAFGLRMQDIDEKTIEQRVRDVMEQAHLVGYDDRHPKELSGGQQQRVAIARALAMRPQLLLLDESLSALDIQTRREVERELHQILDELKLMTVMVSHQYSDALSFADHIIVLERGDVIQRGVHADLLQHPRSGYVAQMVGVNRLAGKVVSADERARTCRIVLAEGVEVVATPLEELQPGDDATVIVHPRSFTLTRTEQNGGSPNIFRCEIMQNVPLSATLSPDDGRIEGLMRVTLLAARDLPPLRAEIEIPGGADVELVDGETVFASFGVGDASAYQAHRR
jgi:molybdate transport system ATP-binding protein